MSSKFHEREILEKTGEFSVLALISLVTWVLVNILAGLSGQNSDEMNMPTLEQCRPQMC